MRKIEDVCNAHVSGNLADDAELKYSNSGTAICSFTLVANTNKKSGDEWESYPNFFDCTIFGRTAESLVQYLVKGKRVFLESRIEQQRWESEGRKRSKIVLLPSKVILGGDPANHRPAQNTSSDSFDDDIPFV